MKGSAPMGDQTPFMPRTAEPLGQTRDSGCAQDSGTWRNGTVALGSCLEPCCPLHPCLGNEGVHGALQHHVNVQQWHLWCSSIAKRTNTGASTSGKLGKRRTRAPHQSLASGECGTPCIGAAKSAPAAQTLALRNSETSPRNLSPCWGAGEQGAHRVQWLPSMCPEPCFRPGATSPVPLGYQRPNP